MFGTMGFSELIIILVIVLIIFGAGRLPQIGEGVGKALKGFKKEFRLPSKTKILGRPLPRPKLQNSSLLLRALRAPLIHPPLNLLLRPRPSNRINRVQNELQAR